MEAFSHFTCCLVAVLLPCPRFERKLTRSYLRLSCRATLTARHRSAEWRGRLFWKARGCRREDSVLVAPSPGPRLAGETIMLLRTGITAGAVQVMKSMFFLLRHYVRIYRRRWMISVSSTIMYILMGYFIVWEACCRGRGRDGVCYVHRCGSFRSRLPTYVYTLYSGWYIVWKACCRERGREV